MQLLNPEQIADLIQRVHNTPEPALRAELALELKAQLLLLALRQSLRDISPGEIGWTDEVMIIARNAGELAAAWLKEWEKLQQVTTRQEAPGFIGRGSADTPVSPRLRNEVDSVNSVSAKGAIPKPIRCVGMSTNPPTLAD
jgi:hypothetical protein